MRDPDDPGHPAEVYGRAEQAQPFPKDASSGAMGRAEVDWMTGKILDIEGYGKNSRSNASGHGQFLEKTCLEQIRKHRPDLADGKDDKELLRLRENREIAAEMVGHYVREKASDLRRAGHQVTRDNLYMAYHFGGGGANKLLRADEKSSVERVLGSTVVKANPKRLP